MYFKWGVEVYIQIMRVKWYKSKLAGEGEGKEERQN